MSFEIDYRLATNETGVLEYEDQHAMANNISEWLDTPVGSVYGYPNWGHPLEQYRNEPQSNELEAAMEMAVAYKLQRDISGIALEYIRINFTQFDQVEIYFGVANTIIRAEFDIKEGIAV